MDTGARLGNAEVRKSREKGVIKYNPAKKTKRHTMSTELFTMKITLTSSM